MAGMMGATLMERKDRTLPRALITAMKTRTFEDLVAGLGVDIPHRSNYTHIKVATKKRVNPLESDPPLAGENELDSLTGELKNFQGRNRYHGVVSVIFSHGAAGVLI